MACMSCTLYLAWDERLAGYDFGPSHPMAPTRLKLTMELARAFGLFRLDGVSVEVPVAATRAELELYHDPVYIDVVQLAGSGTLLGPGQFHRQLEPDGRHRVAGAEVVADQPLVPGHVQGAGHDELLCLPWALIGTAGPDQPRYRRADQPAGLTL